MRAERAGQIWSYAIVEAETYDGRKLKVMAVIDEFTHECLTIRVLRDAASANVVLVELYGRRGHPETVRIDDGALAGKSYLPSFIARLRGGLISSQAFASASEAQFAFDGWKRDYNGGLRIASPRSPTPAAPSRMAPAASPAPAIYGSSGYGASGRGTSMPRGRYAGGSASRYAGGRWSPGGYAPYRWAPYPY
jgi:hypothetical protein